MSLDAISIPPKDGKPPTHLLVILHGWGANAEDLAPLGNMFSVPNYQFIFPNAPFPHFQVPWGRAWYALEKFLSPSGKTWTTLEGSKDQDLLASRQILSDWLVSLEKSTGVPLSRTILCGFSQGGAMTLDVGLRLPVAGLCSLSGYLHSPPLSSLDTLPPVLIAHGKLDPVVPIEAARQAQEKLTALGVAVEYREFNMGHEITPEVLIFMQKFLLGLQSS